MLLVNNTMTNNLPMSYSGGPPAHRRHRRLRALLNQRGALDGGGGRVVRVYLHHPAEAKGLVGLLPEVEPTVVALDWGREKIWLNKLLPGCDGAIEPGVDNGG